MSTQPAEIVKSDKGWTCPNCLAVCATPEGYTCEACGKKSFGWIQPGPGFDYDSCPLCPPVEGSRFATLGDCSCDQAGPSFCPFHGGR